MTEIFIVLIIVLGIVAASSYRFKNDETKLAPVIFASAAIGALVMGMGLSIRELVEGPFAYLDGVLATLTGMIFVMILMDNGTMPMILNKILRKKRSTYMQALLLILFIALPGIFTGTAIASIATTGGMVGKYLLKKGVQKYKVVELVSFGSLLGMLMPPICLPAMVIVVSRSGSYPATFEGYTVPLALATLPALLVYASIASKKVGEVAWDKTLEKKDSPKALIPLIVVTLLLIGHNFLYALLPFLGYPLIFVIGIVLAVLLPVEKVNLFETSGKGLNIVAPVVAVAFAIGSLLEILALTGVTGKLATIFYTVNPGIFVLVSMILVLLCGAFVGSSFAGIVGVMCSYVIGAISFSNNMLMLAALSVGLCVGIFTSTNGGLIQKTKTFINVQGMDNKKIISSVAIPLGFIFLVGIIYAFAYESLKFLII